MKDENWKLNKINSVLSAFDEDFRERPGMIGGAEEVNAIFFYLDKIRFILESKNDFNNFDRSWLGFLIEKKMIVGARDCLAEGLKNGSIDFDRLIELRSEYLAWRESGSPDNIHEL